VLVSAAFGFVFVPSVFAEDSKSDKEKLETVYKLSQRFEAKYPDAVEITPAEARALSEKGTVVFIDVRGETEQAVSMLPGAVIRKAFEENPGIADGKTAVAYCTIGARSGSFSQKMSRRGVPVRNLSGGILAWLLEGGKVFHAGEETRRVHVYGDGWNFLPDGYEAATGGK
jgi:sodium/bile acid cotransporter 7